jgi:hypothetical protein
VILRNYPIRAASLVAALVLASAYGARAKETAVPRPRGPFEPRFYVCFRSPKPIVVDGKLDDPGWKKAEWTESFVDVEGGRKASPRFRTRVKMLWDDSYFYVAADIEEPGVWATYKDRDSVIYEENDFEVFIDPDGDTQGYCELEMNALNTVCDRLLVKPYRDGGPALTAWDIRGLKTAVRIEGTANNPKDKDKGWTVEIAFPWMALREFEPDKRRAPDPDDQWRVNFSRVEYRTAASGGAYAKALEPASGKPYAEDNWTWSPQGLINLHYPEMWGYVQFTSKTAGQGKELFSDAFDEPVKWALRRIYYAQRALWAEKRAFAVDLASLGLADDAVLKVDGWDYPPVILATDGSFEAVYRNSDGIGWHIRRDGLVWKVDSAAERGENP